MVLWHEACIAACQQGRMTAWHQHWDIRSQALVALQGQANHFVRYAPVKIGYGAPCCEQETEAACHPISSIRLTGHVQA